VRPRQLAIGLLAASLLAALGDTAAVAAGAAGAAGAGGADGAAAGSARAPWSVSVQAARFVSAHAAVAAPARMLVYAQEWALWPSRGSLPAGSVIVQLSNRGQDAHDLRIRRLRHGRMTGRAQGVAVTSSGRLRQGIWHLRRGTYELYCSMPGHVRLGMHARLVVR
jgi:hypothetical protein